MSISNPDYSLPVRKDVAQDFSQINVVSDFAVGGNFTLTGTGALNGNVTVPTGKTLTVTDADALLIGGVKVGTTIQVDVPLTLAANGVDQWAFVADRAYQVTAVKEVHAIASSSGTVLPRKVTDVSAPGAGAGATVKDLITAALNTNTTANTTQTGTLSATASDLQLAAGDKIGVKTGGTFTSLVGGVLQITLKAI